MHLKREEFEEMMIFLEKCYNHPHYFFPRDYPHVWGRDTIQYENRIIAKEDGRIVSHVGIFPLTAMVEDAKIKMGGIGGVATLPEFRGRGYMRKLMNYCIQNMKEEEYSVSILWGDRQRYSNFGYEVAGREVAFELSKRSLKKTFELFPVSIRRLEEKKELIEKIILIHKNEPLHIKRKKEDYPLIFSKHGLITLLAEEKGEFAYLSFYHRDDSSLRILDEYGGNHRVLFSLIYAALERWGIESVEVPHPYYPTRMFFNLLKASSSWHIYSPWMLKILNLRKTINSYFPIIEKRAQKLRLEGALTLKIVETGEKITLCLNSGLSLTDDDAQELICLPEREMVRFLFGSPYMVDIEHSSPLVYLLFPLSLYVGPLDAI